MVNRALALGPSPPPDSINFSACTVTVPDNRKYSLLRPYNIFPNTATSTGPSWYFFARTITALSAEIAGLATSAFVNLVPGFRPLRFETAIEAQAAPMPAGDIIANSS